MYVLIVCIYNDLDVRYMFISIVFICENHNCQPHPHTRAPCMKYFEGSIRPIYMYRPRKYVIPGT